MSGKNFYQLPELPYGYKDLEPNISEELLTLHHDKHHAGYVNGANAILETLDNARKNNQELDMKSELKALSFNVGGHVLHSLFWENMSPDGGGEPEGKLAEMIDAEFGSLERFRKEFWDACKVEGSGWAVLAYCSKTGRLMIGQVEKHSVNVYPGFRIIMTLDLWEHAFYLDYKNEKGKFIEAFWNVVNWKEVGRRLEEIQGQSP
ncbi:superoxide dismutase [Candidatus Micrarchaeota archaeon]|nr:superoxide dismutase [Candidatus Micrarchaeota archaeon]